MRSIIHPLKGAFPSVARDRSRGSVSVGGPDETLECEVGPLLDSYRQDGSFLERPAFEVAARDLAVLSRPGDQTMAERTIGRTTQTFPYLCTLKRTTPCC